MFKSFRFHRNAALALVAVALLVLPPQRAALGQQASAGATPKPHDHGTATAGVPVAGTAEKSGEARVVETETRQDIRPPGTSGLAGVTAPATIVNMMLCGAAADQTTPFLVTDGDGGGVVVWQDGRVGAWDVYAQRVGAAGATDWVPGGVTVCKASGAQMNPQGASDGAGGVIIAWQDGRPGAQGQDVYAQRVSVTGTAQWAAGGVSICGAVADQTLPVVVGDGQGGAVVAWVDERALGSDVYAQRINAWGVAQWGANGVALCTAAGVQGQLAIVTDGQRGAIVVWQDRRGGTGDIYARRVDESGVVQWAADGVALCAASGEQETPVAVVDQAGGALVGWADARGAGRDVYAQRVNGAGVVQWAANGVGVCVAGGEQSAPALCGDGAGGALLAWQDARGGGQDVYAQRVNGAGVAQWTADGVGVCTATADQVGPALAADPLGGAVVGWSDARTVGSGADIYVQHLTVGGGVQWTADGVRVCDAVGTQDLARVMADGVGGAAVVWRDYRNGATSDLYGQRVDASGQVASQCLTKTTLLANTPVTASSPQNYYNMDQTDFYWCGVGVRSAAGSDWDLGLYLPVTFGMSRYPICFSGPLAGSFAVGGVDFVVGDFNIGHTMPVIPGNGYSVRASRYAGAGAGTVEWDSGADVIAKDCGTGGGCGAKSGNNWSGVLDVWDVYLFGNTRYSFDFTRTGSADIKLLLFGSTGTTGTFFVPRSAGLFETTSQTQEFVAPDTAWYGVALVNDNGLTGTYTVRVVTLGPVGVDDPPRPATGLRAVAPNPSAGRVQIQFALDEPGEAAFEVLDLAGRMVARIPEQRHEAGTWSVGWEGRTSEGTLAAPGVYFVQMRLGGRRVGLARLALIR
jgi:flagellar hook capping protein FlgD